VKENDHDESIIIVVLAAAAAGAISATLIYSLVQVLAELFR